MWSRAAAADTQQFRVATLAPPGSPWMELLERAAAEIAKETDQRVMIKYYPGGQQGDERFELADRRALHDRPTLSHPSFPSIGPMTGEASWWPHANDW